MLLDCFMFTNEYDLLEGRLEYLNSKVDKFIIIESNITHNGTPKKLNFLDNMERYSKYLHKIFYYPVNINPNDYDFTLDPDKLSVQKTGWWAVENYQRNWIASALQFFDDEDDVMISDLDEIPLKVAIDMALVHLAPDNRFIGFKQDMLFYNFNWVQVNPCFGTVLAKNKTVKEMTPQWIREHRWQHQIPFIVRGGYHLSFWFTPEMIQYKIMNAPHQEDNTPKIREIGNICRNISLGIDIYERNNPLVEVQRNTIDQEFMSVFQRYEIIV
jgi:beta-1,4-mannosyl-glycoprotein beta-1,4-N-acetylglucosaminyltransferase